MVMVKFELIREGKVGPILGPFKFIQLTYEDLRDDSGDTIAVYDDKLDDWYIVQEDKQSGPWSDIIIYSE